MSKDVQYSEFVEHPRYGQGPRITKLVPKGDVYIGWHARGLIPDTAVKADTAKQSPAMFQFTHYYDLKRKCRDCSRAFIFFADEQKYWYEELQFGLDSDCVRCVPCRKVLQGVEKVRKQYEDLSHVSNQSTEETLTMAECALELMEKEIFGRRPIQRIRMLLNRIEGEHESDRINSIRERLNSIEQKGRND